jgi:hypothetical protein
MKRPVIVTIMGILLVLAGIGQLGLGGVILANKNDATFLKDADITSSHAQAIAIALLAVGVLSIILAIGLLKGSRLVRDLVGLLQIAQIGVAVYTIAQLDSGKRPSAVGSIVGALIVLYFLFGTDKAKSYFAKA